LATVDCTMANHASSTSTKAVSLMAIILLAANLRSALTAVGLLIEPIQATTGISLTVAGLLNSLPLVALGIFAPLGHLGRRFGVERMVVAALLLLTIGILVRSQGNATALFLGSGCLAAGIAIGNVMVPGIIKRDFSERAKGITTTYVVTMGLTAAIASGLAIPLSKLLPGGWQASLGVWAIPAAVAALIWVPYTRHSGDNRSRVHLKGAHVSPWQSGLAWLVTLFMGLQSLVFYVAISWFPTIFQNNGFSPKESGLLIVVFQVVALGVAMAMPLLLRRAKDQSAISAVSAILATISVVGLMVFPNAAYLWMVTMGIGGGAMLILALAFISLRSSDHHQTASLSVMSQSVGYLIAAAGPFCFGLLHDLTGEWRTPLTTLAVLTLVAAFVGFGAGRNRSYSSVPKSTQP
jgi:CP family cyanate transporter-like MFS transporter